MIREKKNHKGPIIIDLTGPDGNAYALMAYAREFGKKLLNWDQKKCDKILDEMMSGDYENLLQVFDREFGTFVILER